MGFWDEFSDKNEYRSIFKPRLTIGIPTINRADLLVESLADIDNHWHDALTSLIIIDNGNQNINSLIPERLKVKTTVFEEPGNLGVAGSWNKILHTAFTRYPNSDHVLLLNDDIVLGKPAQLIFDLINNNPNYSILGGNYYWASILISKYCIDTIGYFDKKFFPAYFEDNDYARREGLSIGTRQHVDELTPTVQRASQTVMKDRSLNYNFAGNARLYQNKWGGAPGHETYQFPYGAKDPSCINPHHHKLLYMPYEQED